MAHPTSPTPRFTLHASHSTLHTPHSSQLLPQSHEGLGPKSFCFLHKCIHIFICPPESEPGKVIPGFNGIVTVQPFLPVAFRRTGRRGQGSNVSPLWGQSEDFRIHSQIQPDLPALPGRKMFRQRRMMGTGRQKHRAVQPGGVGFRYGNRAGKGGHQPGGKGSGLRCVGFLEIQHNPGTVHGLCHLTDKL